MSEFVSISRVTIDGKEEDNIASVSEKEVTHRASVELMRKTGVRKVTPRVGLMIEYVVPTGTSRDWSKVENAVVIIEDDGQSSTTYTGVYEISTGEAKRDGNNALTKTIELIVTGTVVRE